MMPFGGANTIKRSALDREAWIAGGAVGRCALDELLEAKEITATEHEAGLAYRACWYSTDPAKRALCSAIDAELLKRVDHDAPFILRCCAIQRHKPQSEAGLERLRQCLGTAAAVILTVCGVLKIAAD
jgi:hypothetical protein